jgi:predicted acyl esterase
VTLDVIVKCLAGNALDDVAGHGSGIVFAAASGTDADWIVKLIDVFPEQGDTRSQDLVRDIVAGTGQKGPNLSGYELIIADEVFRGRFRNSYERPEPVPANQIIEYKIDLHTNDHAFLKGHRIMVQVQSTWFPLIDRNPQKYVENIYEAKDSDYVKTTQKIFRSNRAASSIVLPVVTE